MCYVVRIDEPLLEALELLVVPPINIIDLFPMLRRGLSTVSTLINISRATNFNYPTQTNSIAIVAHEQIITATKEQEVSIQLSSMVDWLSQIKIDRHKYTIYDIVLAIQIRGRTFECEKLLSLILKHPQVDLLTVYALQNDIISVKNVLNHSRSNKVIAYSSCSEYNIEVSEIIKDESIRKLLLYREIFCSFGIVLDIYVRILSMKLL